MESKPLPQFSASFNQYSQSVKLLGQFLLIIGYKCFWGKVTLIHIKLLRQWHYLVTADVCVVPAYLDPKVGAKYDPRVEVLYPILTHSGCFSR